ncbi:hypothetical protein NE237_016114 [Protea cynaroides]|uniref:Putative plant transposon protein domain-containing protein n=1 Tax=Protea cynaroides TaxID=273540 RepID=A0A9Q0KF20_9MAGN|nr:hypothetical protein NE237_016114 [Protea cynaroides]
MGHTQVPRLRDPLHFRSNEVEAQYADYARKKVKGGHMVNLAKLTLFNVEGAFGDMGWLLVITYDACTCPDLVHQFYCNLQVVGNYNDVEHGQELRITSYVKGVHISFDYWQLADLLGIAYDGPMVYCAPGEPQFVEMEMRAEIDNQLLRPDRWQMRACYLRPAPRVFCKIIQHNLIPQSGHYERVSQLTQFLIYCICTRQPVCLPYIIMRTMISATLSGHRGNLPYGRMITVLLTRLGVDLVDEKIQEKTFSSPLDWEAIWGCEMRRSVMRRGTRWCALTLGLRWLMLRLLLGLVGIRSTMIAYIWMSMRYHRHHPRMRIGLVLLLWRLRYLRPVLLMTLVLHAHLLI